ncbi:unnamed protein product [Cuscuta campestris]|uniref:Uncharacterized protein n=1 Tax=Cuscuta campestris TaxID=132261 RepID=A0A484KZY0_9ASTE|nr:unnamed protein product [Cuscuta campestris]
MTIVVEKVGRGTSNTTCEWGWGDFGGQRSDRAVWISGLLAAAGFLAVVGLTAGGGGSGLEVVGGSGLGCISGGSRVGGEVCMYRKGGGSWGGGIFRSGKRENGLVEGNITGTLKDIPWSLSKGDGAESIIENSLQLDQETWRKGKELGTSAAALAVGRDYPAVCPAVEGNGYPAKPIAKQFIPFRRFKYTRPFTLSDSPIIFLFFIFFFNNPIRSWKCLSLTNHRRLSIIRGLYSLESLEAGNSISRSLFGSQRIRECLISS